MSNKINQEYEERTFESFQDYVADRDWESVNNLFLELQDQGFSHLEPKFIETLTDEELAAYRRFHRETSDQTD